MFQDLNHSDITVLERSTCRTFIEIEYGKEVVRKPGPENDMVGTAIGVVWSRAHAMMNKVAHRGGVEKERVMRHFRDSLTLYPIGGVIEYITDSDHMMEQWTTSNEWSAHNFEGRNANPAAELISRQHGTGPLGVSAHLEGN
jgi:hypothetical protein